MIRRLLAATLLAISGVILFAAVAGAQAEPTTERLPGTSLEAEERDDGGTSAAPWVIGSGVAALAVVGVGGLLLKRRVD
ncbi:MAG: hypothetical protein ACRDZU_07930 [Acidimicrobiales bacterium]